MNMHEIERLDKNVALEIEQTQSPTKVSKDTNQVVHSPILDLSYSVAHDKLFSLTV